MSNEMFFADAFEQKRQQNLRELASQETLNNRTGQAAIGNMQANRQNAMTNVFNAQSQDKIGRYNAETDRNKVNKDYEVDMYNADTSAQDVDNRFKLGQDSNANDRMNAETNKYNAETNRYYRPLAKGTARVPGKGSGDKVPTMLEPGEAVLNRKAAGMIGRDKIAAANKKGNQARAKEDNSKVAALLKKMGML